MIDWCYSDLKVISKQDLNASKVLYRNGLYPQAIFMLQQSLEKAIKAMLVYYGLMKCADLKSEVGHKIFENIPRIIMDNYDLLLKASSSNNKEAEESIDQFSKKVRNETLPQKIKQMIIKILRDMRPSLVEYKRIAEEALQSQRKPSWEKTLEDVNTINSLITAYDAFVSVSSISKVTKPFLGLAIDQKDSTNEITNLILFGLEFGCRIMASYVLSSLLNPHVSTSRYPEETNMNPVSYTQDKPLIKNLKEIEKRVEDTIDYLESLPS